MSRIRCLSDAATGLTDPRAPKAPRFGGLIGAVGFEPTFKPFPLRPAVASVPARAVKLAACVLALGVRRFMEIACPDDRGFCPAFAYWSPGR